MNGPTDKNVLRRRLQRVPDHVRQVIQTIVLSLAAGLSAVGFLFLTNLLFDRTYLRFSAGSPMFFATASLIVILGTSILVGLLLNVFSPEAAGSGIPQVKSAYWKELGAMDARPVLVKFVAGVLSIGGGSSLGREGPSVFIGSGVASNLDGALGRPRRERRAATIIGASAGLAAAFNTPIAAITFAIEEVTGDLNSRHLGRVVLSSVVGAFVVYAILGRQPAFSLPNIENVSWLHYAVVPPAALLASTAGVAFQRTALAWRARIKKAGSIPAWLRPAFGGLATWVLGVAVFTAAGTTGVFGLGYRDLSAALNNVFDWKIAGVLIGAKLLATIASYAFGGCGGIFAPTLFIGGMSGYFVGGVAGLWLPLTPADRIVLSAVGMSACLGSVVRAPLTSLLIVFEMTHQFELVPALMLGTLISQAVARLAGRLNFYDALLVQDGHELHKIRPPLDLQSWQSLPVSAIANPRPVVLSRLDPAALREAVDRHPYAIFPVVSEGKPRGALSRQRILESLRSGEPPEVQEVMTCRPEQPVREIGDTFLASPLNVLVVVDGESGDVRGIITLHDLIRAQAAVRT